MTQYLGKRQSKDSYKQDSKVRVGFRFEQMGGWVPGNEVRWGLEEAGQVLLGHVTTCFCGVPFKMNDLMQTARY